MVESKSKISRKILSQHGGSFNRGTATHAPATHGAEVFVDVLVDGQGLDQRPGNVDEWGRTDLH